MSKIIKNPLRIISGIPSFISLIIILFCPVISESESESYNFFAIIDMSDYSDNAGKVSVAIICCAILSLFAIIMTIFYTDEDSKIIAISSNIIGLIPDLLIVFWLASDNEGDIIGVAIYLYIIFNIIAAIMLGISDMIFNSKSKNSTMTNVETLKRYKELFDSGAITKEEYENQTLYYFKTSAEKISEPVFLYKKTPGCTGGSVELKRCIENETTL